jgi:preprotein translocase subunit SecA
MSRKLIDRALRMGEASQFKAYSKRVARINEIEPEMEVLSDEEILEEAEALRELARNGESLDVLLPDAFALCREAGKRSLGMRHFDVQLVGGMALHEGSIAEMKTGEGKTLAATLPIFLNSLAGGSVHLVTVNDYLARRDADWMKPLYDMVGVKVGVIQNMQSFEDKQVAYTADVTYGTNSEFGFDYLRDNMATSLEEVVQRGHPFGIVDEVDNILIDEARTPLIISGAPEEAADWYVQFARLARRMEGVPRMETTKAEQEASGEPEWDYEYDEKHKTVSPTARGIAKAERDIGVDNLYLAEHGNLVNHLVQALKAESLYKRDKDYAVIDGEVMIIDEFTGRILEGRRWSEGLHQAVEAKEGVSIREENQTLATITLQNYFRMYDKLAGMTGTALTEANEFLKIYKLNVVDIPTNMPMVRADFNDQIYKTKEGKWQAVRDEIKRRHETGQPVLVGTISVEVSENLSDSLKKSGVKHVVLNAKPEHAEREGETIAEAGRPGAVTIATNMAGRGVDIKLGGNPEHMTQLELRKLGVESSDESYQESYDDLFPKIKAQVEADEQDVKDAGGLFILGTERHESRRIDNQLRGRSGRQGDPGESRFYLSAEDDLVRLFAGDRIYRILDRLGPVDEEGREQPIEAKMLSRTVENAQKKVEQQNFLIRKRVLEYDDVLNQQRTVVYRYRREILEGRDMSGAAKEELRGVLDRIVQEYTPGDFIEEWDVAGLFDQIGQVFEPSFGADGIREEQIVRDELVDRLHEDALSVYERHEEELGEELMRNLERAVLMQIIDTKWREHLLDMDYLREGIHLRGFAQKDPLIEYKNDGFRLFEELMNSIWEDFARYIFHVEVEIEPAEAEMALMPSSRSSSTRGLTYTGGGPEQPSALYDAAEQAGVAVADGPNGQEGGEFAALPEVETRQVDDRDKIGRNDPCWCGSGKKYKKCHGA